MCLIRGSSGLCLLNKSRQKVEITKIEDIAQGEYSSFLCDEDTNIFEKCSFFVSQEKLKSSIIIEPKSALFFIIKSHNLQSQKINSMFSDADFPSLK
jgi:hypothetical protein